MDMHARGCLVGEYENLIEKLNLPDPDDRHLLAAAIKCEAEAIVTFNLRDFPNKEAETYGMTAISPASLISVLWAEHRENICLAFSRQLMSLKDPSMTKQELLTKFKSQELVKTSELLEDCRI